MPDRRLPRPSARAVKAWLEYWESMSFGVERALRTVKKLEEKPRHHWTQDDLARFEAARLLVIRKGTG